MIQLFVIIAYLSLLIALGYAANRSFRGTAKDYMLASHSIGPVLLLMSLFGTTMTAFALVGSTGRAYTLGVGVFGLLASASGIVHSLCFFLIGVPIWSFGRRHGYTTQIQFFRDRLQNDTIGVILFPVLVLLVVGYLLLGVVGGGAVVNGVTAGTFSQPGWLVADNLGVPNWLASATICGVVLTYVFLGGMRGAAWANTFQTAVFMVLGVVTFVVVANAIGGTDKLWENMRLASESVSEANITRAKIPPPIYFSFLFIPLSVGMFPHVFQHWLTARSAATFKLPIVMHPIFILIVWLPCVLIGIWASGPLSGIATGTDENTVLAELVRIHAGPVLGGLLTAGILAAIMSSLDSQFLCIGTMFTEDILLHYRGTKTYSDQQTVFFARCFVVVVVLLTFLLSLVLPHAVFDLGLWSFSGFTGLFPLVLAAVYWKRLTAAGAIASVITTISVWGILFYRSGFGHDARYGFPEDAIKLPLGGLIPSPWPNGWIIPPMLPVVAITLASAVVLVVVSLATRPPSDATLGKFFRKSP